MAITTATQTYRTATLTPVASVVGSLAVASKQVAVVTLFFFSNWIQNIFM